MVIENGTKDPGQAVQYCRDLKTNKPWGKVITSILIAEKTKIVGLQAADFLAYNAFRLTMEEEHGGTYMPPGFERSLRHCHVSQGVQSRSEMELATAAVAFSGETGPK